MFDYSARLQRVQQAMGAAGLDLIFLNLAADLEYLTGIAHEEPNYGNTMYPGEWLTGAWIPQQGAPILTLPRMLADFHLGHLPGYDVRVLPDAGDPAQLAADVLRALEIQGNARVAVEDRAWAELVLNLQRLLPVSSSARLRRSWPPCGGSRTRTRSKSCARPARSPWPPMPPPCPACATA